MDPVTQGVLGASWAQNIAPPGKLLAASVVGCIAGMAPDIDVLIRSSSDPLLFLEYHRHFTHSLAFIPFGAAICAALLYPLTRRLLQLREVLLFSLLGYASHGVLDACTAYGTLLLWPFSSQRIAWNNVSVFDPLFTVPLLALVVLAARRRKRHFALLGLAWAVAYLSFGAIQTQRAVEAARSLAQSRGHEPARIRAMPAIASVFLWRTVYEYEGRYYVDAVKVVLSREYFTGESIEQLMIGKHFPWLEPSSQQAIDVQRFRTFTADYLGVDSSQPNLIIDLRYSMLPNETDGIWGIEMDQDAGARQHVNFVTNRTVEPGRPARLLEMLF